LHINLINAFASQNQNRMASSSKQSFGANIDQNDLQRFYQSLRKTLPNNIVDEVISELGKASKTIQDIKVDGKDSLIRINPELEDGLKVWRPDDLYEITSELPSGGKRGVSEFTIDELFQFKQMINPKIIVKNLVASIKEATNSLRNKD